MTIIPASIRNRNPGAMYPGPSSKKFGSASFETLKSKDGVHKIATFHSDIQGAAAMFDLLASKYCGQTVEKAITKWCGAFYVSSYIKVLESTGGIKRSDILTKAMLQDAEKGIPLARAMALQEAGREYPLTEEQWRQAHACAFLEPVAPAFAADNDVPSPKEATRVAAKIQAVTDVIKPIAAVAVPGGAVVAANVPTLPSIPAPPTAVLEQAGAWKGFATSAGELVTYAATNPKPLAIVAVAGLAMWLGPKFLPNLFGKGA